MIQSQMKIANIFLWKVISQGCRGTDVLTVAKSTIFPANTIFSNIN